MSAFNFKKSFIGQIQAGTKNHTIRSILNDKGEPSKRHRPRVGESKIQLYTGMRTTSCRKLVETDPTCVTCQPLTLEFGTDGFNAIVVDDRPLPVKDWQRFAIRDGFENEQVMFRFWLQNLPEHCDGHSFAGFLTSWRCQCAFPVTVLAKIDDSDGLGGLSRCTNCGGILEPIANGDRVRVRPGYQTGNRPKISTVSNAPDLGRGSLTTSPPLEGCEFWAIDAVELV